MVHARHAINELQDLAAVDIATKGPAATSRPTTAWIKKGIECLLDLGLYTAPIGMGPRPYTDVHVHFQVLRTHHFDPGGYAAAAVQITPDRPEQPCAGHWAGHRHIGQDHYRDDAWRLKTGEGGGGIGPGAHPGDTRPWDIPRQTLEIE